MLCLRCCKHGEHLFINGSEVWFAHLHRISETWKWQTWKSISSVLINTGISSDRIPWDSSSLMRSIVEVRNLYQINSIHQVFRYPIQFCRFQKPKYSLPDIAKMLVTDFTWTLCSSWNKWCLWKEQSFHPTFCFQTLIVDRNTSMNWSWHSLDPKRRSTFLIITKCYPPNYLRSQPHKRFLWTIHAYAPWLSEVSQAKFHLFKLKLRHVTVEISFKRWRGLYLI